MTLAWEFDDDDRYAELAMLAAWMSGPGGPTLARRRPPWQDRAACRGMDPDLFHPLPGDPADEARAVCARCMVRRSCLDFATSRGEGLGVWGGVDRRESRPARTAEAS